MPTENSILMKNARESLKGKWGLAIGFYLVFVILVSVVGSVPGIGTVFSLLITGPLTLGAIIFSLGLSRGHEAKFNQLFYGFHHFSKSAISYLLVLLYTLLWSLLLIVPGIIAAISYSMTFYILADDLSLTPKEAIDKSKKMMYGYKWKFFKMQLRFIGWGLLCILTLGIGFLWLVPYIYISFAKFYDDIKDKTIIKEESPKTKGKDASSGEVSS